MGDNYDFKSSDVVFLRNNNLLNSKKNTTITDNDSQFYKLENFQYSLNDKILKGNNILIKTNYNKPNSDSFYFSSAIINLENKLFTASDTKIEIHKNIFSNKNNDPRIFGVSSKNEENKTILNKAIFTSCKKNDDCPPWSISAQNIEHDKLKKQITYNNAILKIYDKPVFYFPKFFHPDPTVNRQSGLLKPEINSSNTLGSSVTVPYFVKISEDKDLTLKTSLFDSDITILQNEFRVAKEKTKYLVDFGFVNSYQSATEKKKKNLHHQFFKLNHKLDLKNFESSTLNLTLENTNNDTYLKVFDPFISNSKVKPDNFNSLTNELSITLDHFDYYFDAGIISHEDLQIMRKSDRHQFNLPYYNFNTTINKNIYDGSIYFSSSGKNILSNTNQIKSNIINDLSYKSKDFISNLGISTNLDLNFKNLNSVGKNSEYKSSPQSEMVGILGLNSSFPLMKDDGNYVNSLIPKATFKFNPSDMKNYSSSDKKINVGNIFNVNRLGLSDTHEAGKSLTIGIDYKKEKLASKTSDDKEFDIINNYFEIKLATVLRDKNEKFLPKSSTLNRKNSNLFGSIDSSISKYLNINYEFAIDNDLNKFEYNNFNPIINFGNLQTSLKFIEENGEMGDSNILENSIFYNFNNSNSLNFNTRRNRKLNLTEYYDLVYEYKNDCLTAGIKYKKTYYEDRDLKPAENLFFTITLFPLTTYEYSADELVTN